MKVALVTTPVTVRSGIGDYTRHLLPYLRESCDVQIFAEPRHVAELPNGCEEDGERVLPADELDPRAYDHVLYQLGNEASHAFMTPLIRAIGGTVMLHDWVLFDLAATAWPALIRGGWKGHAVALREGGLSQARTYFQSWVDRRRDRGVPYRVPAVAHLPGDLLAGWFEPEPNGRWITDRAVFRVPGRGVTRVSVGFHANPSRSVALHAHVDESDGERLAGPIQAGGELAVELDGVDAPLFELACEGVEIDAEQRKHADSRRLGCFVDRVAWTDAEGEHELDLSQQVSVAIRPRYLSDWRFQLPFNRTVVRQADTFITHSNYVKQLVLGERNAVTPVAVIPHGAERRWRDEDRVAARRRLGLPPEWDDAFLVVSFGGVQSHKRIDQVMRAVGEVRRAGSDVRLLLAGGYHVEDFDPEAIALREHISDSTRILGYVTQEVGWDSMQAGDVCVNLRGPTSGGTSGGIYQSLSLGRPVVATGAAEQAELPDSCIVKVPLGDEEVPSLVRVFGELAADPGRRAELERCARAYVDDVCHWSHTARMYVEALEQMPGPRVTRKSILQMRLEESKRKREERAKAST